MTTDQIMLFSLFGGVFVFLLWGRFRYDMVAFGALILAVFLGLVPSKEAFSGFGHPATIIVALVLVVSSGLVRSGAVHLMTRALVDSARPVGTHITIMGAIGAVFSAFMNNVAALALLMPVDVQAASKAKRAAALTLMPLSFATILGGMVTLIGTPPNIIIASIREDAVGTPFAMFDFAPVGLVAASAGLIFVAFLGWRLLPHRGTQKADRFADLGNYLAELTVPDGNKLIGQTVAHVSGLAEDADVAVLGLIRGGKRLRGLARNAVIQADDTLVLEADPDALDELRSALALDFVGAARSDHIAADGEGLTMVECVVTDTSRVNGRTAEAVGLSWRQQTVVMGISRQGKQITSALRKTILRPGDILLLLTPQETADDVVDWLGCLPLADRGLTVTANHKMLLAVGLFVGAVAAASFGLVYLPIALGAVAVAYVATGIVPLHSLYDQIEWPVVVLMGAMLPLGAALEASGGTALLADYLLTLTNGMPAWVILTVLMLVTMTLSDVLNNVATAIVCAPIGIEMAAGLGVSPDPFLMAVAVAASAAFLTPIGHKNNTLIMGPGGYKFGDYWRMGLPLEIVIVAVSVPALLLFWPL
ncbi:MAG: SLC13 family permease [Planktomarina sp.]